MDFGKPNKIVIVDDDNMLTEALQEYLTCTAIDACGQVCPVFSDAILSIKIPSADYFSTFENVPF